MLIQQCARGWQKWNKITTDAKGCLDGEVELVLFLSFFFFQRVRQGNRSVMVMRRVSI